MCQDIAGFDLRLVSQAVEICWFDANDPGGIVGAHQTIRGQTCVHGAEQHDTGEQSLAGFLGFRIAY